MNKVFILIGNDGGHDGIDVSIAASLNEEVIINLISKIEEYQEYNERYLKQFALCKEQFLENYKPDFGSRPEKPKFYPEKMSQHSFYKNEIIPWQKACLDWEEKKKQFSSMLKEMCAQYKLEHFHPPHIEMISKLSEQINKKIEYWQLHLEGCMLKYEVVDLVS